MKKIPLLLIVILSAIEIFAQDGNPFAEYGYYFPVVTATNGRFQEIHDNEEIVVIGTVLFHTIADTVVGEFVPDTAILQIEPQTVGICRFLTPDPLAEKYYHISPYAYCANNPVKYIDPDGRDFYVAFHGEGSRELFERIYNEAFNDQFKVSLTQIDDKNLYMVDIVATEGGGDFSKISKGAQGFYDGMKEVIDDHRVIVSTNVYNGNSDVHTGNYRLNSIDVGDMHQFDNIDNSKTVQNSATRQGKMVHEAQEQYNKKLRGYPVGSDKDAQIIHDNILKYEDRVNGNERLTDRNAGRGRGVYEYFKKPDGTIVRVRVYGGQNSKETKSILDVIYQ
jgi:hypothetical protein